MILRWLTGLMLGLLAMSSAEAAVKIQAVTSPGGITAWLVEDHSLPVVTLDVSFAGGAVLDPPSIPGLATLTADLLDEGAGTYDSEAFQSRLEDLATSLEINASEEAIGASLRTTTANLQDGLAMLGLALTAPRFDAEAVARVRAQLTANLAHHATEPRYIANRLWQLHAFAGHPYAHPVEGTQESIARITAEDLHRLARERLAKDVMLIGVVGDITPEALKTELDRTFGPLPEKAAAATVPEVIPAADGAVELARMMVPQSVVVFGQHGVKRDDPDWYAALIVNYILGDGGFSSRLTAEVREKRGLAYSIYSQLAPMQHSALIEGSVATRNDRVQDSIDIIREEWGRMSVEGPSAKELADAKTYLTG